jgi:hypothetical protein
MPRLVQQPAAMVGATTGLQDHLGCILAGKEAFHLGAPAFAPSTGRSCSSAQ